MRNVLGPSPWCNKSVLHVIAVHLLSVPVNSVVVLSVVVVVVVVQEAVVAIGEWVQKEAAARVVLVAAVQGLWVP